MLPTVDSRLSRFIFSQRHFSVARGAVKHGAFMPPEDGKLSVFDTESLPSAHAWAIGQEIALRRSQTLHARGDIGATVVLDHGLRVVPDEPPPRHRNIEGWPPFPQKEDQKLIAMELAAEAILELPT